MLRFKKLQRSCRELPQELMHRYLILVCMVQLCGSTVELRAEGPPDVARSGIAGLVTGAPEHLRNVVDAHEVGTGPFVEIIPIDPTTIGAPPYPPGVTVTDDLVAISDTPQNAWFELRRRMGRIA